jgi:hypothetical protein
MRDSLVMEKVVQGSDLDWTIARPPRLTQGQSATYRSREGAAPKRGFSISRKAVAAFMLDAIDQKKYLQKIVGIAKRPVVTEINLDAVEKNGNEFNQDGLKQDGEWLQCRNK